MTEHKGKTTEQLVRELSAMRRRVLKLEKSQIELKYAEDELRNLHHIQSLILENSIMGIAFVRRRIFEWVNSRLAEMLGLPLDEVQGASVRIMYASDQDYEDQGRNIYQTLSQGEWFEFELDVHRPDGKTFTARIIGKALNPSLAHEGSIWMLEDITDRRQTEENLRESEEKYRTVVEKANEGIVIIQDRCFAYVNPKMAEDILGVPAGELIGKGVLGFIHPEDRDMVVDRYNRRMAGEDVPDSYEIRVVDQNKKTKWLYLSAKRIQWNGKPATLNMYTDITGRKQAETALREGEAKYRLLVETSNDLIWILNAEGVFTYVSPSWERTLGYEAASVIGKPFQPFIHPEDVDDCNGALLETIHLKRQLKSPTYRVRHADGTWRWHEASGAPVFGPDGSYISLVGISRNIDDRKQAEEELREAHKRLDQIIEYLPDATLVIDTEGKVIAWNRAMEQMTGIKAADMLGKDNYEYALPFYGERRPILIDLVLQSRGEFEARYVSTDRQDRVLDGEAYISIFQGKEVYLAGRARTLQDSKGNIVGAIESIRDITERRKAEEKYRGIFDNAVMGIFHTTPDGRIINANPALARILGYESPDEVISTITNVTGQLYADSEKRSEFKQMMDAQGSIREHEIQFIRKDGNLVLISLSGRAVREGTGRLLYYECTIQDITERKRLEHQLGQAQKMEAIGTLAGGIAHDFNNILASMIGFTEMAARESRPDVRRKYHDRVLQSCSRAKNLVDQILSFSRMQEQQPRPLNVKLILKETLILLRATLPATIEIRHDITREDSYVLADPTQVHQIIINLCANAAQAMLHKGGIIDIRLDTVGIKHAALSPQADLPTGPYVVLSVRDTGHGIDPTIKDRIFDPFFTTKNTPNGTGLGLSVVYGIIKRCGGAIDVQSVVGKGTTFTIYLPRIGKGVVTEKAVSETIDLRGNEKILFVDDEESLVTLAKGYFASKGYRITATTSSKEALTLFQKKPDEFDILITDMTMPGMTGMDMIEEFLKKRPDLPVILCTGYRDAVNEEQFDKMNVRELVLKPFLLDDLGRLVRRTLDS